MITEIFSDTEKGWSAVLACLKILARDGHPVKISKDEDGVLLLEYTYEDNETLEWAEKKIDMQFTTNTLTFYITEWEEASTTMKALKRNGYTVKSYIRPYLGDDEIIVEFTANPECISFGEEK